MAWSVLQLRHPIPRETQRLLAIYVGVLVLSAGVGGIAGDIIGGRIIAHRAGLAIVCGIGVIVGATLVGVAASNFDAVFRRHELLVVLLLIGAPLIVSVAQYMVGPRVLVTVLLYVEVPIFAVYLLPRIMAVVLITLAAIEFGMVLILQRGYSLAVVQWAFLAGTVLIIGMVFGGLLRRSLDEATRMSSLKRFLAPQVAEAVLSSGSESILEPHRREVAVLFCDLRGFTNFSASTEPEEVVNVLMDYYETVGTILHEAEATVGTFAGDGIMAYFNDPVPCADPALTAVRVAMDLRAPLEHLVTEWSRKGFDLGYGIGVAFGHATLGTVGFEGRSDYTALGPVVNLAARLCGEAASGEILIDQRAHAAIGEPVADSEERIVHLKGYHRPVTAFCIS